MKRKEKQNEISVVNWMFCHSFRVFFFNIQEHPFVDVFEGKNIFEGKKKFGIIEKCSNEAFRALWVALHLPKHANVICGVV